MSIIANCVVMKLWVRLKSTDIESSDLSIYQSNWRGGNLRVPQVPWPKNKIHIVESVCRVLCLCPGKIKYSISRAISYLSDSGYHGDNGLLFSLFRRNYLVYGYGVWDSNHGIVSFLHKPCAASAYLKAGFIKPYKQYRAPHSCIIKKWEGRKKYFFSKANPKKGRK